MPTRTMVSQFDAQVRQLPPELQESECALIELGRRAAADVDAGHGPSGGRVRAILTDLRKLVPLVKADNEESELDKIRARRAGRLPGAGQVG